MKRLSKELIDALEEMEQARKREHPDSTVQWAVDELSDEGHAYLFGPGIKVLEAFKRWKASK